jgi:hypothetical protein
MEQKLPSLNAHVQICNAFQVDLDTKLKADEASLFLKTTSICDAILQLESHCRDKQLRARRVSKRFSSWTMVS